MMQKEKMASFRTAGAAGTKIAVAGTESAAWKSLDTPVLASTPISAEASLALRCQNEAIFSFVIEARQRGSSSADLKPAITASNMISP
jgi:hypothetical protein